MNKILCIAIVTSLYLIALTNAEASNTDDGKLHHVQTQHDKTTRNDDQSESTKSPAAENVPDNTDHSEPIPDRAQASGIGVVHALDADKRIVNLTHEPMPELGWPTMTMDLAVTKRVDLSGVKAGDKIKFKVKLGRDRKYRISDLEKAE